jgi:hypothetical protein
LTVFDVGQEPPTVPFNGQMNRIPVTSSSLHSVGYDDECEILEVQFGSGSVYQYLHVPRDVYEMLMTAPSVGNFFVAQIKDRFPYRQVS